MKTPAALFLLLMVFHLCEARGGGIDGEAKAAKVSLKFLEKMTVDASLGKGGVLDLLTLTVDGTKMQVPKEELSGLSWVNLQTIKVGYTRRTDILLPPLTVVIAINFGDERSWVLPGIGEIVVSPQVCFWF